jgi:solute carrier family 25 S-adenosylmethionine transporter 26
VGSLAASALSAAASCVVSVPQEVIKQRLVTKIYPSFRSAVESIAREEGIRGFYSAWKPTMARNIPFVIITFTTMDFLKNILLQRNAEKRELGIWDNVVLGMSSAFVAGAATNPADVIKTRMMTQAASAQIPYSSAIECMQTIIRTEGLGTFYAGFKQRSTYMCLLWGMTFAINGLLHREMQSGEPTK